MWTVIKLQLQATASNVKQADGTSGIVSPEEKRKGKTNRNKTAADVYGQDIFIPYPHLSLWLQVSSVYVCVVNGCSLVRVPYS